MDRIFVGEMWFVFFEHKMKNQAYSLPSSLSVMLFFMRSQSSFIFCMLAMAKRVSSILILHT